MLNPIQPLSRSLSLYPPTLSFYVLPPCHFLYSYILPLSGAVVAGAAGQHGDGQPAEHAEEGGGSTAQSAGVCTTQRLKTRQRCVYSKTGVAKRSRVQLQPFAIFQEACHEVKKYR